MKSFDSTFNEYDYLFKFILMGASGVGKTSIILRYADNTYNESYSATIGLDFKIKTIKVENKTVKLQIWDTAGQERYNALSSVYYKGSHGCIAVYDITNPDSFETAKKHLHKAYSDYGFPKGCALLVGNKIDLEDQRKVNRQEALQLANLYEAGYIECSAKTSESVEEVFLNLCQTLVAKSINGEVTASPPSKGKSIVTAENIETRRLQSEVKKKETGCCT